jgi:cytochrome c553
MRTCICILALLLPPAFAAADAGPDGERLAYVIGCVNCHHQTPKEMINAPSLEIARKYSLPEFTQLLRTGRTRLGRDLLGEGSLMGIVAVEQLSHLTDVEIAAIYAFLTREWSGERAAEEEAKIPILYHRYYEDREAQ